MCVSTLSKTKELKVIKELAIDLINSDYTINGEEYNIAYLGWSFEFNDRKKSLGLCSKRRKTIYLSEWLIRNSTNEMADWKDTILHEIAHAIDFEIRGRSAHDYHWRSIAITIGCNGERCGSVKFTKEVESKYTIICNSCGTKRPSFRRSRVIEQGRRSCGKCSNGVFNKDFALRQIQNY